MPHLQTQRPLKFRRQLQDTCQFACLKVNLCLHHSLNNTMATAAIINPINKIVPGITA